MASDLHEIVVISVGGSVIVPDMIDVGFLKGFADMIRSLDMRFVLVTGGGRTCRRYMEALAEIGGIPQPEVDWVGIKSTRLNAQLLKAVLSDVAEHHVIKSPEKAIELKKKAIIAGGWRPGFSSDGLAVELAKRFGAKRIINITDVGHVYDRNPKEFPDARPLGSISWKEMEAIVGSDWKSGMHAPFDPVASRAADEAGISVVVIGKDIANIRRCLEGEGFEGTTIS